MTDRKILSNAIDKAIANGFEGRKLTDDIEIAELVIESKGHYAVLFSHSFAKTFWGEEEITVGKINGGVFDNGENLETKYYDDKRISWQYHLQQMVLEENPIKYLEKFL